jgi:hypothetical protein
MPRYFKTRDGRWRKLHIVTFVMSFAIAVYEFIREGLGSLSGIQYLLFAIGVVALAPSEDTPKEHQLRLLRSPRYLFGVAAMVATIGVVAYRVAHQHH